MCWVPRDIIWVNSNGIFFPAINHILSVCFPQVIEKRQESRVSLQLSLSGRRVPGGVSLGCRAGKRVFRRWWGSTATQDPTHRRRAASPRPRGPHNWASELESSEGVCNAAFFPSLCKYFKYVCVGIVLKKWFNCKDADVEEKYKE